MLWCETSTPDLGRSRAFAEASTRVPGQAPRIQLLAVVQLEAALDDGQIAAFQKELGAMGYRFQFITLAGFHALNASMFELAKGYAARA
jgi:isocitrate lyase